MKKKYLWIAVEADEYELPIAVADTAKELGAIFGVRADSVIDSASKNRSGKLSGRKFIRVEDDNEHIPR